MVSSDSQIDKLQLGHPKRADLPDVNINTGVQSINTERASSKCNSNLISTHLDGLVKVDSDHLLHAVFDHLQKQEFKQKGQLNPCSFAAILQ